MPMLPVIAILAVVAGLLAVIGSNAGQPSRTAERPAALNSVAATAPAGEKPVLLAAADTPAPASNTATAKIAGFTPEQKKAIEQIIRDYLVANPEVLGEVQQAYEAKQEATRGEQMKQALSENASSLFRSANAPIVGNPKGDVTVVEFFDYNCGYCKRALSDVAKLIESDKRVKFVFKELPIFGKDSEGAARVAIAAKKQNKYWEVHKALLELKGKADEAKAVDLAVKAGANVDQLKKDIASADTTKELEEVKALAEKMGIQGTPHFFIGDKMIPGAPDNLLEVMTRNIAEVRKSGGCKIC